MISKTIFEVQKYQSSIYHNNKNTKILIIYIVPYSFDNSNLLIYISWFEKLSYVEDDEVLYQMSLLAEPSMWVNPHT